MAGCFNLIYGIAAIASANLFVANAHYVFSGLNSWGRITLILGVLQLCAVAGVLTGKSAGALVRRHRSRLNAIDQMFFIPAYPFWPLTVIAMEVIAPYGPCAYKSRENMAA